MQILMILGLIIVVSAFCIQSLPRFDYPQVTDPAQHQVTVNQKGRTERIFVNLEAIYHAPDIVGSELSLEELRASRRGWLSKIWEPEIPLKLEDSLDLHTGNEESSVNVDEIVREVSEKLVIARDPVTLDENGVTKETGREGRGRRMKIKEVNETQISKLQDIQVCFGANTYQSKQSYRRHQARK
jgi:checkpoint serine/threonine-protein kinase